MTLSIAGLNSGVWLGLGKPEAAVIELDEIHYETRGVVTLITKQLRASDNNQQLSVTSEFTPTTSPYNILSLIGRGTPAWLEVQNGDRWDTVRCVNKAFNEEAYNRGLFAASFYGMPDGKQFLDVSFPVDTYSTGVYRIWYDQDEIDTTLDRNAERADGIQIPISFAPYLEMEAMQPCIMKIRRNLAESTENDEEGKLLQVKLATWLDQYQHNEKTLNDHWRPQFRIWKNRQRTAQNQSRLPSRTGKGMYGQ